MKWGILATGTIAKKFASTVEQMGAEGEQLVAVGSRHLESAQAFAQQYGIPRCYDSYEALAADPEVARAVQDAGAAYVLQLDHDVPFEDGVWLIQTNEDNRKDFAGIEAVDDDIPGFEVVMKEGDMRLYRIVPPNQ